MSTKKEMEIMVIQSCYESDKKLEEVSWNMSKYLKMYRNNLLKYENDMVLIQKYYNKVLEYI